MKRFGVMIDVSRNAVMKPEKVKQYVKTIKSLGYNMVQLYTEDTYEVEGEPYFGYLRGRYTEAELKDIVDYAEGIGVEVIPCIQTLAHLKQIFYWRPYWNVRDCDDILLVDDERTYQLIENMFKTLRRCFKSQYVHIGMDEAHNLGLGKYLDIHGPENRFDILQRHLNRVIEIAEKYGFKPLMWSDMFFRLANHGEYYPEDPTFLEEAKRALPDNLALCYWDYYHSDRDYYAKMLASHEATGKEIWFAGGGNTWYGFASGNSLALKNMLPAMRAARESNVENIFMTLWGDNGKECSSFAALPSLYAIKRVYDGEEDMDVIKAEFKDITGENFDDMFALDIPNFVSGNDNSAKGVSKYALYSDPFCGFLDVTLAPGESVKYTKYAEELSAFAKRSKNYAYVFESMSALCKALSVKYDLGRNTRAAYDKKDKNALKSLISEYDKAAALVEEFYEKFRILWFEENKPNGFEVQDIRLGGLIMRLKSCRRMLEDYVEGRIPSIPELEEPLLDYYGNGKDISDPDPAMFNGWAYNVSVNNV